VITDKLASYPPAIRRVLPHAEHRRHKGLNNRAENSHLPTRKRERVTPAVQIRRARATFLGPVQRSLQPLPPTSTPTNRLRLQTDPHPGTRCLAGRHSGRSLALRQDHPGETRAPATSSLPGAKQLDNADKGVVAVSLAGRSHPRWLAATRPLLPGTQRLAVMRVEFRGRSASRLLA